MLHGFLRARDLLHGGKVRYCLIGGVDSLLNHADVSRLKDTYRLHGPAVAQGVIPGEAAAFLLLSAGTEHALGQILSAGSATEEDTVLGPKFSTGRALLQALHSTLKNAGIAEASVSVRISAMNGERYQAWESLLAAARFYRTRRERMPVLYPSVAIGDVGAAAGALLPILAIMGISANASGPVMCETSGEEGLRAACLVIGAPLATGLRQRQSDKLGIPKVSSAVIPSIISQHASELAFLWTQRERMLYSPCYTRSDLSALEERMDAHLDGLTIAGEVGWQTASKEVTATDADGAFCLMRLALRRNDSVLAEQLIEQSQSVPSMARGLLSALAWPPWEQVKGLVERIQLAANPHLCGLGLAAAALHRQGSDVVLGAALKKDEPELVERAIRAVGQLGRPHLMHSVWSYLTSANRRLRYWALWTATLLREPRCEEELFAMALADAPYPEEALTLALRRMPIQQGRSLWRSLNNAPERWRLALFGAAALGEPAAVSWIIEQLAAPERARLAGAAFSLITGVDLERENLSGPRLIAAQEADDDDAPIAEDPDDGLAWPVAARVSEYWVRQQNMFPAAQYLGGLPLAKDTLGEVLLTGHQDQRWAAAIELMAFVSQRPLVEVRAPVARTA